jgi:hypothetical protein
MTTLRDAAVRLEKERPHVSPGRADVPIKRG